MRLKENEAQLNVAIDKDLKRHLDIFAASNGLKIKQVVEMAVIQLMGKK